MPETSPLEQYYHNFENVEDYEVIAIRYNVKIEGPALKPEDDPEVVEILPKEEGVHRTLALAVLYGDKDDCDAKVQKALDDGADPIDLINNALMKGMDGVSALYTKGEFFLPDLMLAGDAMMSGVALCEAKLGHKADSKANVVCCAVEGDPHDIGKNLICMFLNANGYNAVDLGRDVPHADVVKAAVENDAAFVTATALMTTTMTGFGKIVAIMQEQGVDTPIGCGGGAVRRDFVEETPQTFYGVEAYHTPKLADAIVDKGKTWEDIRKEYAEIVGEYVAAYS
ncbi:methanol--corrinoid protein MtaC [Methanosphaera sp. BMS]|uniref:methanol--corrinoid protein MtaC n=1 Tax=Methanosphaera sp. BMS TaxID=1789762 RepID=UPI000DC1E5F3|nr:methanol--corrinoid protein MtaC [Methanosphaera sp. BMS]AWX32710.1 cobalamin-binding protein [Methanosphaera sp. BMS]MBR3214788.1 B12-binding domain-containing protein [Methanosphaera sp.]